MSKFFHEIDEIKRHIRMADIKLSMKDWKECKAELNAAVRLLGKTEKTANGKHEQESESGR
jgi:biotin-(acetyl-CoA carboxylase) ligase